MLLYPLHLAYMYSRNHTYRVHSLALSLSHTSPHPPPAHPPRAYSSTSPRTTTYAWRCSPRSREDLPLKKSSTSVCAEPNAMHSSSPYPASSVMFPLLYHRLLSHRLELTSMAIWISSVCVLLHARCSSSLSPLRCSFPFKIYAVASPFSSGRSFRCRWMTRHEHRSRDCVTGSWSGTPI